MTVTIKDLLQELTLCPHPKERVMQVAISPSVIQWCCQCGALRSLDGSQTWMRSDIADGIVALAIRAVEVAG